MKLPLILLLTLLVKLASATDVYKIEDEHGNIQYTDTPPGTAQNQPIELKPYTRLPVGNKQYHAYVVQNDRAVYPSPYTRATITEPANDTTIRNGGNFTVRVKLNPKLAPHHRLVFYLDGIRQGSPRGGETSLSLSNVDRGTHQLAVEVIDHLGNTLKRANSTVHVQRPAVRQFVKP